MRHLISRASFIFITLLMFTGSAQALLIEQTETDFSSSFAFNSFNGALGTLTEVRILFDLSANFTGHDSVEECEFQLDCEGNIKLQVEGGPFGSIASASQFVSNLQVDEGFNIDFGFSGFSTYGPVSDFLSPIILPDFLVSSFGTGDLLNSWTNFAAGTPTGDVTLRYTYDAASSVPVSTTLALFGLGLASLGWSRRKKA